jgi:UDP-galactopyranose mutase
VLIVGAGFAGSVSARTLAEAHGLRVLVIDRRSHIGGNAYDTVDEHGVLVHTYGPHIFHTNAEKVVDFLSRFTEWRPYEHRVVAEVDGRFVPMPINRRTVQALHSVELGGEEDTAAYLGSLAEPREAMHTSEDSVVAKVGRDLYERLFRGYTRKQWALDPSQLHASVCARIPVRANDDDRYFTDSFQRMPADGYTAMFERMLDHPNITVWTGVDYDEVNDEHEGAALVWTGPIDSTPRIAMPRTITQRHVPSACRNRCSHRRYGAPPSRYVAIALRSFGRSSVCTRSNQAEASCSRACSGSPTTACQRGET